MAARAVFTAALTRVVTPELVRAGSKVTGKDSLLSIIEEKVVSHELPSSLKKRLATRVSLQ